MSKIFAVAVMAAVLGTLTVVSPVMAETPATPEKDPVVARVNGTEIHRSDLAREARRMGPQLQQLPADVIYPQLLQKLVLAQLVAEKGYDDKLQNDPEVKERLKEAESQIVGDVYVHRSVQPKITDDKIKAKYNEMTGSYKPQDEVHARHILVPTEADAKNAIKRLSEGEDFAKLAAEKSKDAGSAKQGGDLGFFQKSSMVKPFADAAFAMKVGDVSTKPVKTEFGYHVIKVEERRKSAPPALEEVKEQVANQVGQEMVGKLLKDLEAGAKIERFEPDGSPMKSKPVADKK